MVAALLILTAGAGHFEAQGPAPAKPDAVRFAVIGDNGTGDRYEYEVAQQMIAVRQRFPFEMVLMLGDNIYGGQTPKDFVQSGVLFKEPRP